jgi:hypothetical protein
MSESLRVLLEDVGLGLAQLAAAIGYPTAALGSLRDGILQVADPETADDVEDRLQEIVRVCARLRVAGSSDPGALLEGGIVEGYAAIGWTLLCQGHEVALMDLAAGRNPEQVLNHYVPDWRERYWTDYETFLASDGNLSLRRKEGLS